VALLSALVIAGMLMARCYMQGRERAAERAQSAAPATTASAPVGPPCEITSSPSAATVYALRDGARAALGITPLSAPKGDYAIRVELAGHVPVERRLGELADPCRLHLVLQPEG
jgi:hypothetical protein